MRRFYLVIGLVFVTFLIKSKDAVLQAQPLKNNFNTTFVHAHVNVNSKNQTVIFEEDFESLAPQTLPSGWTAFDIDGLKLYKFYGFENYKTWAVIKDKRDGNYSLITNSYFNDSMKTADDWAFTPEIELPTVADGENIILSYLEKVWDKDFANSYEVRIMTEKPTKENIAKSTVIRELTEAEVSYRLIRLTKYAGQKVYIGWRNYSTDKFVIGIDNVKVTKEKPKKDIAIEKVLGSFYCEKDEETALDVLLKNTGNELITSFAISCSVNGKEEYTKQVSSTINPLNTYALRINPKVLYEGEHTIEIKVNMVQDEDATNNIDSITINGYPTNENSPKIKMLSETFTASWCGPCARWNPILDEWIKDKKDKVNYIKYQFDDYKTQECEIRAKFYGGIEGIPTQYLQGKEISKSTKNMDELLAKISNHKSFLKITSAPKYEGKKITIPVEINSLLSLKDKRIYVAVCEKTTTGNVGTNGETEFYNVLMKMLPNVNGTQYDFVKDKSFSKEFEYDMSTTNVEEMNDLVVVIFVQDPDSKEVLQSETFAIVTTGIEQNKYNLEEVNVYPNPVNSKLNVNIKLDKIENVSINIFSVQGKLIYSNSLTGQEINKTIDVSEFEKGFYLLEVTTNKGKTTKKFIIDK